MFERFTNRARQALSLARQAARTLRHSEIESVHVLMGIVDEGTGVAAAVLRNLGVTREALKVQLREMIRIGSEREMPARLPYAPRVTRVVELAVLEARNRGHDQVGTEHLLLGLIADGDGAAARVLSNLKVTIERARGEAILLVSGAAGGEQRADGMRPAAGEVARALLSGSGAPGVATLVWLVDRIVEQLTVQKDEAVRRSQYERAAELRTLLEEVRRLEARVREAFGRT